jgi:predicted transcriptional regulator
MTKGKAASADRQPLTISLDAETLADLDRLAVEFETTREHLLETAVLRFVNEEFVCLPSDADDPLANLPPYKDPSPEGQALDRAGDEAFRAFAAFIKVGEDCIERGEIVTQEEMEEWFARRVDLRGRSAAAE